MTNAAEIARDEAYRKLAESSIQLQKELKEVQQSMVEELARCAPGLRRLRKCFARLNEEARGKFIIKKKLSQFDSAFAFYQ